LEATATCGEAAAISATNASPAAIRRARALVALGELEMPGMGNESVVREPALLYGRKTSPGIACAALVRPRRCPRNVGRPVRAGTSPSGAL